MTVRFQRIGGVLLLLAGVSSISAPRIARAEVVEQIVAVVNDEVITQSELNDMVEPVYAQLKHKLDGQALLEKLDEVRRDMLGQLVDERLIFQAAKKEKIEVTDQEVDDKLGEVKTKFGSEDEFNEALASQGLGADDLRKKYREQLMARKLISREISAKVFVSPSEIAGYYETHPDIFRAPESVEVWNILIRADKPTDFERAKGVCDKIRRQIVEGASFEDLAKGQSQGPGRGQGGAMGRIHRGELLPAIDQVIFTLKEGEISDPIRTDIGYHLFKISGRQEASQKPLESVKDKIERGLFEQKAAERYQDWVARLRRDAYVSIK